MPVWWERMFHATCWTKYFTSLWCVCTFTTTSSSQTLVRLFQWVPRQVSAGRGSSCGHRFKWGAHISLTACSRREAAGREMEFERAGNCQQVTEACTDQTRCDVKHSGITGPIWRQYYTVQRSPFSHSLPAHGEAVPILQIWIKHRTFVAWIYCCWNVDRVKKTQAQKHLPLNWKEKNGMIESYVRMV